jgi:hypothetical protein
MRRKLVICYGSVGTAQKKPTFKMYDFGNIALFSFIAVSNAKYLESSKMGIILRAKLTANGKKNAGRTVTTTAV